MESWSGGLQPPLLAVISMDCFRSRFLIAYDVTLLRDPRTRKAWRQKHVTSPLQRGRIHDDIGREARLHVRTRASGSPANQGASWTSPSVFPVVQRPVDVPHHRRTRRIRRHDGDGVGIAFDIDAPRRWDRDSAFEVADEERVHRKPAANRRVFIAVVAGACNRQYRQRCTSLRHEPVRRRCPPPSHLMV